VNQGEVWGSISTLPKGRRSRRSAPENGLSKKSSADTSQVRSISQERLIRQLGVLSPPVMRKIGAGLALSLALES
jgi:mRNA-degrading endonuclease toxin of MazEF toxin-antitoxin module